MTMTESPRYSFSILPSRTIMWGMSWEKLAPLAGSMLFVGFATTKLHIPLVVALIPAAVVTLSCFITVKERKMIEYIRVAFGFLLEPRAWVSPLPMARLGSRSARPDTLRLPPELSGLAFSEITVSGTTVGAIEMGRGKSKSVVCVLEISSVSPFLLLTPGEQGQLLAKWGLVLDQSATEEMRVRNLEWIVRITPAGGNEAQEWADQHMTMETPPHIAADYHALLGSLTQAASGREYYLVVEIATGTKKRGLDIVSLEIAALIRRLKEAELVGRVLDLSEVTRLMRAMLVGDPINAVDPLSPHEVAPKAREVAWDYMRVDDSYIRSCCVHNWPAEEVGPAWLQGLLAINGSRAAITIAVHLRPTRPSQSRQRVRAAITTTEAAVEYRRRGGFASSAQANREQQEAKEREEQLVSGYKEHRIGCVLTVTASSLEELEEEYDHLVHSAESTGIRVRKLYLEQKQGLAASLPLGRLSFTGGLGGW